LKIRGLCAYAEGTGQDSAGTRYLLEECKAFEAAKGNYELRKKLHLQILDVLGHVADAVSGQKDPYATGSDVLDQLNSLEGERATAFYKQHRSEILSPGAIDDKD
jgi:hypothetical protein